MLTYPFEACSLKYDLHLDRSLSRWRTSISSGQALPRTDLWTNKSEKFKRVVLDNFFSFLFYFFFLFFF